jgi:predicted lysophospholipase L1 biosynthesis ABC-type transport system permease subunit
MRRGRNISLVLAVYLVIGLIVAYDQHYITSGLLKRLVSMLLGIVLWPLLLLDVDLHVG